jgi:hypothetical protein
MRTFLQPVIFMFILATCFGGVSPVSAASLQVSGGQTVVENGQAYVEVNVTWDLSWRNDTNWDAAWLFAKVPRRDGESVHLPLAQSGHRLVSNAYPDRPGAAFSGAPDSTGVFVYRDAQTDGRGPNDWTLRLRLALPDGVSPGDLPGTVDIYGVEMVYIPEGPFEAGDPAGIDGPGGAFFSLNADSSGTYRVADSGPIPVCDGLGSLCYAPDTGDQAGPIPAGYPNGYDAFYLMKYKLTQGAYTDFLNTLTPLQTAQRALFGGADYHRRDRGSISKTPGGTYVADAPDRAANYVGWRDAAAFADWAGLRPMSTLEYEKAARGPAEPVPDEFAWGTTRITRGDTLFTPDSAVAEAEAGNEFMRGNANLAEFSPKNYIIGGDGGHGPVRVDLFESHAYRTGGANLPDATSLREAAGISYYGVATLQGRLFERAVTLASKRGRAFQGQHGDGDVSYSGLAARHGKHWPNRLGQGLTLRGKAAPVADRRWGAYPAHYRGRGMGFRAARTAP